MRPSGLPASSLPVAAAGAPLCFALQVTAHDDEHCGDCPGQAELQGFPHLHSGRACVVKQSDCCVEGPLGSRLYTQPSGTALKPPLSLTRKVPMKASTWQDQLGQQNGISIKAILISSYTGYNVNHILLKISAAGSCPMWQLTHSPPPPQAEASSFFPATRDQLNMHLSSSGCYCRPNTVISQKISNLRIPWEQDRGLKKLALKQLASHWEDKGLIQLHYLSQNMFQTQHI